MLQANPKILKYPSLSVSVSELVDSSVNLVVRPFCKPEDYWDVFFAIVEGSKMALDKARIEIFFPHEILINK